MYKNWPTECQNVELPSRLSWQVLEAYFVRTGGGEAKCKLQCVTLARFGSPGSMQNCVFKHNFVTITDPQAL